MSFCLILLLQIFVFIFSINLCIFVCANIFGEIVLKPRFKIDAVIMRKSRRPSKAATAAANEGGEAFDLPSRRAAA